VATTVCGFDEFRCANGQCVHLVAVCNWHNECGDGSDEIGCGKSYLVVHVVS